MPSLVQRPVSPYRIRTSSLRSAAPISQRGGPYLLLLNTMTKSSGLGRFFPFMFIFFNIAGIVYCTVIPHGTIQPNQFVYNIIDDQQMLFSFGPFFLVILSVM